MDIDKKLEDKSTDAVGKVTGFFLFRNLINSYNNDKNLDEEERKKIKKYGVVSLILSLIAFFVSGSFLLSTFIDLNFVGFSYVLMVIVFILCGVLLSLLLSIYGFIFGVMQIRLNRKSIGIFGLVLSIVTIIISILLIVFMIV